MRAVEDRKTTIYDVAARAGASASTVSSVLSGSWRSRRISATTADRVERAARDLGYVPNLQARGLRQARSGLVGMIVPEHENRFFSQLAQAFSIHARTLDLLPTLIATRRDPAEELRAVEALIAHSAELLLIAGATAPEALSARCRSQGLPHVFVDQPCPGAPSVTTDNAGGMAALTNALLTEAAQRDLKDASVVLLGGDATLPVTKARIAGFRDALAGRGDARSAQVIACGYGAGWAQDALASLHASTGGLPGTLIVNSISAFEGTLRVLSDLPEPEVRRCAIGCFDYSPFLRSLWFPVWMMRQRTGAMIREAFAALSSGSVGLRMIEPELMVPRGRHGVS